MQLLRACGPPALAGRQLAGALHGVEAEEDAGGVARPRPARLRRVRELGAEAGVLEHEPDDPAHRARRPLVLHLEELPALHEARELVVVAGAGVVVAYPLVDVRREGLGKPEEVVPAQGLVAEGAGIGAAAALHSGAARPAHLVAAHVAARVPVRELLDVGAHLEADWALLEPAGAARSLGEYDDFIGLGGDGDADIHRPLSRAGLAACLPPLGEAPLPLPRAVRDLVDTSPREEVLRPAQVERGEHVVLVQVLHEGASWQVLLCGAVL
mmetsp:Transcript_20263/g.68973  ORF Transcript_20263/g.68973 Transcript_20263/m.68973 type:complete len:269 (+) Transcript_20263:952-1758(+)